MVLKIGTPIKLLTEFSIIDLGMINEALDSLLQLLIAFLCIFNSVDCFVDTVDLIEMVALCVVYCSTIFGKEKNLIE